MRGGDGGGGARRCEARRGQGERAEEVSDVKLVVIGQQLDQATVEAALDSALLTPAELKQSLTTMRAVKHSMSDLFVPARQVLKRSYQRLCL